jgi:hypothetical protein
VDLYVGDIPTQLTLLRTNQELSRLCAENQRDRDRVAEVMDQK